VREFFAMAVIVTIVPLSVAKVWTTVYRCDETTPLALADPNLPGVYQDIMVGTRLVIVVSSDTGGYWLGQLRLSWDNAEFATLSGRGPRIAPNLIVPDYRDSCLEAAGTEAHAWDFSGPEGIGLEFTTTHDLGKPDVRPAVPGDWFIFDYHAERVGSCDVSLYEFPDSLDVPVQTFVPVQTLSLTHVPSRDFDGDTVVNFEDFILLAGYWHRTVDPDPNSREAVFDLNSDSRVDTDDLALFSEYWLERTDCNDAVVGSNSSPSDI